jgi:hypothetical protein
MNYHWLKKVLYFQNLVVPKSEERIGIIKQMQDEIGHFGESKTLAKVKKRYFLHDITTSI